MFARVSTFLAFLPFPPSRFRMAARPPTLLPSPPPLSSGDLRRCEMVLALFVFRIVMTVVTSPWKAGLCPQKAMRRRTGTNVLVLGSVLWRLVGRVFPGLTAGKLPPPSMVRQPAPTPHY